jgi:hypothetical protein
LEHHLLDVIWRAGRLIVRARGPVEQTRVAVEQPALVPLGQRGAADAAFVGDVRVWAASVDAFAETGCR